MLSSNKFAQGIALVAMLQVLGACEDSYPRAHGAFVVGMSQAQAFAAACEATTNGEIYSAPVLYTQGERRRSSPGESICDLEEQAMHANEWEFVEPGLRERFVVLSFEEGQLTKIRLLSRGWDP